MKPFNFLVGPFLVGCLISGPVYGGDPWIPESGQVVLAKIGPESRWLRGSGLRLKLAQSIPQDEAAANVLARRLMEMGQSSGDPRYFGFAEGVMRPWWSMTKISDNSRLIRASLRQQRHDFVGAEEDLSKILTSQPRNNQAWLILAVIQKIGGRLNDALVSCSRIDPVKLGLAAATCITEIHSLSGYLFDSYTNLEMALSQHEGQPIGGSVPGNLATVRWTVFVLADMAARLGRFEESVVWYEKARAAGANETAFLSAYADVLIRKADFSAVEALLADAPVSEASEFRLALARVALGKLSRAEAVTRIRERLNAVRQRGEIPHAGDEARFELFFVHNYSKALTLALKNWTLMKSPADARLVIQAAIAAKDKAAASEVVATVQAWRLEDVSLRRLLENWRMMRS